MRLTGVLLNDIYLKSINLNFPMATNELAEIEVVADIAIQRETPVAFSNVDSKKIQEELGSRDLPLILNSDSV